MVKAFVIGHPVAHSRSPLLHGFWLDRFGIRGSYERIDVAPADLPDFLRGIAARGFAGGNVTVPHKEGAFAGVDVATERARRLGAVNTLWFEDGRLHGDNTDGIGFTRSVAQALGPDWAGRTRTALVLGAGGAARAVVPALLDEGVGRVLVANRDLGRARALAVFDPDRVAAVAPADLPTALAGTDLLVNTTSLGMKGQPPLAIDLAPLPAGAAVADIVYVPLETPLLAAARRRGLATVDGLGMLLHQAVPGFRRWFGTEPVVDDALRAHVLSDLEPAP